MERVDAVGGLAEAVTLDQFARSLERLVQREPEMCEGALTKAAEHIRDECKALIGTEDEAWAALAVSTISEKERLGYVGQVSATDPLLRSGEFRESWAVGPVDPRQATVGSSNPLAPYFERGTSRMPARPVLGTVLFQLGGRYSDEGVIARLIAEASRRFLLEGAR